MVNEITAGIADALSKKFGERYTIYTKKLEQDFSKPCFFIQNISAEEKQFLKKRYRFTQSFVIQFFTEEDSDIYTAAEKMMEALEYIKLTDLDESSILKGRERNYKVTDEILDFFVRYDFYGYLESSEESLMEILKAETNIQ